MEKIFEHQLSIEDEQIIESQANWHLVDIHYRAMYMNFVAHSIILLAMLAVLYEKVQHNMLYSWFTIIATFEAAEYGLLKFYKRIKPSPDNIQKWSLAQMLITIFISAAWGAAGYLLMPENNFSFQILLMFLLFILSAGFTQGAMIDLVSCYISISFLLIPLITWCFIRNNIIYHGIGIILLIYYAFLFFISAKGNNLLKNAVLLRYKNMVLSGKLEKTHSFLEAKVAERAEQLRQAKVAADTANKAKTEFLGIVSHELRTPLRVIESASAGLQKYIAKLFEASEIARKNNIKIIEISKQQFEKLLLSLTTIQNETDASFNFIKNLLNNLVNIGDKLEPNSNCSINNCLEIAFERYPFLPGERKLLKWQKGQDFNFNGNEILMIHVLFNFIKIVLHNIQNKGQGHGYIWIEKTSKNHILYFRDTSNVISADELPKIFEHNFLEPNSIHSLGLVFCRMVITSFGGSIRCDSPDSKYTEFIFEFPVC